MAQGKLKVKTKLPQLVKSKSIKSKEKTTIKRRGNAPIQPKKKQHEEVYKLKKKITKTLNKTVEDELRKKALDRKKPMIRKDISKLKNK